MSNVGQPLDATTDNWRSALTGDNRRSSLTDEMLDNIEVRPMTGRHGSASVVGGMAARVALEARRFILPLEMDEHGDWRVAFINGEPAIPSRNLDTFHVWSELDPGRKYEVISDTEAELRGADMHDYYKPREAYSQALADKRYLELTARQDAERRLAGENYTGTRVLAWDEFWNQPEPVWLVHDLIGQGTTNFLVAKRNMGKTFVYLDMALRMVTGMNWYGKATTAGKVMLVIGEGLSRFHKRMEAWCRTHDVDPAELRDSFCLIDGANLSNDESLRILADEVARFQPDLIVFDTWAATSGTTDENDAALAQRTINAARAVAPDAALLWTAHPNRATEDTESPAMRGSGAMHGAADCILTMFEDRKYKAANGLERKYMAISTAGSHAGKTRDSEEMTLGGFYLESVTFENGTTSAVVMHDESGNVSEADEFAFKWLEPGKPMKLGEVTAVVERALGQNAPSESTVRRHLDHATNVERGKSGRANTYKLTKRRVEVSDEALTYGKAA